MYGVDKIQEEIAETGKITQDVVNVKQIISTADKNSVNKTGRGYVENRCNHKSMCITSIPYPHRYPHLKRTFQRV